ncbi:hypothetical protein Tco_0396755 [Tanacetum coccineum]
MISYIVNSSKEATMRITRGIPPPSELSTFRVSINDKKRKRSSEILQEIFVKENIVVDEMHKNLVPPPGVEGRRGMVIREPESGVFFYNGNFDLNEILRRTPEAEEFFKKLDLTIEARNDVNPAKKIVLDNLDGIGQHM